MTFKPRWKERMSQSPSKAEIKLLLALESHGLARGAFSQMEISLWSTQPDIFYPTKGIAIYLDGPPHLKGHVQDRDEKITERLQKKGLKVLRFSYTPPISDQRLDEIVQAIKEALEK